MPSYLETVRYRLRKLAPGAVGADLDDAIRALADDVDVKLAPADQGPLASRPVSTTGSPGRLGRTYRVVQPGAAIDGVIFYDTGSGWVPIRPLNVVRETRQNQDGTSDYTTTSAMADIDPALNITARCSGAKVEARLTCLVGTSPGLEFPKFVHMRLRMDNSAYSRGPGDQHVYNVLDNAVGHEVNLSYIFSPSPGDHTFAPQFAWNGIRTAIVYASALRPVQFSIREL